MAARNGVPHGCIVSIFLLYLTTSPVYASDWMIVGVEPDAAPHRSMYVMQYGAAWISRRLANDFDKKASATSNNSNASSPAQTVYIATVLQVFENAGGTNYIQYQVEFMCPEGMVRIPQATAYDRKGVQGKSSSPDWIEVPDNWLGKAEMIACNWKNWQEAEEASRNSGPPIANMAKVKAKAASFESLGMQYLGNIAAWSQVVDAVWNKHWTDATQPSYYVGTAEEQRKSKQEALEVLEQASGVVAEHQEWTEIYFELDRKAERLGDKFSKDMSGVGGLTEDQVIARWGAPQSVAETPGVRHLTYYFNDTQYGVNYITTNIVGATGIVGQMTQNQLTSSDRNCRRTLSLKEGGAVERAFRVFDFSIGCN